MSEKLVITGMGAVTPIGIGVDSYWNALLDGACGIAPITRINTDSLTVKAAAEVKGFNPRDYLSSRLSTDLDTFMQYAFVAAEEALAQSGLEAKGDRVGVIMGTALNGLALTGASQEALSVRGKHVGPRFVSQIMGNIAASQLAIAHGITGLCLSVSTACSSGGDAIATGAMLLSAGDADAIVVMAGEAAVSPLLIESLTRAGALSKTGRSLPFDANRDGFVIGEGGGAVILETESHALDRGAVILAELAGWGNNTDAYHTVSPEPSGKGAAACMGIALRRAGMTPDEIDYVNAHGTATHAGDIAETCALKAVFGSRAVPVSSTKGATGHMMGAGGVTETITCIKAIATGTLPPCTGCTERDSECDLNIIMRPERAQVNAAMSNALGFGGQNSCIIVRRY
ncbi:MAG: beta-ketoacyl-[acyl-carrier-protein] synthase family protein [Oscillospiraceae bacterium]|nr:beta-ketoacyl-[acyl-carrier-protein] synthase family protein [Oscillospiraceae bacterium]